MVDQKTEKTNSTDAWWLAPLAQCLSTLGSETQGLTPAEVVARRTEFGQNVLAEHSQRSILIQLLTRFASPLVIILLIASILSAMAGDLTGFILIVIIISVSVTLDFVQEYRAGRAAEKLRSAVAVRAQVKRAGGLVELPVSELVPGDMILVSCGDLIPADARLLDAKDLFVNQAALTGESYPVEKHAADLPHDATDVSAATNALFMGTSVISGKATAVIVKTGRATAIGAIAEHIDRPAPPTAFDLGIRRFGMLIMRLTVFLVLFVLLINAFFGRPWLQSFLFAIALAVGLTPELLPMVVSVTLSRGAMQMAKRKVIVKRLTSIQNLGAMDVLCTDKTGTLTEAKIELVQHLDTQGRESSHVFELAFLNSHFETGLKSPLDEAILRYQQLDVSEWRKIDEVPFDFDRRRVSVLLERGNARRLILKGAPEDVINICSRYDQDGNEAIATLDDNARANLHAQCDALAQQGMRVLGIAWREVGTDHPHAVISDETDLIFAGFAVFLDPPKPSAGIALRSLMESGIVIKIVTGDSELVAQHVCSALNIPITGVITGDQISRLDNLALQSRVEGVNLFCRVNPTQKERIIRALRARGHVVGYLGDGINDAPSLHAADVGLSVDSAVDVAKASADMILLEHDLSVLHEGVLEGRRTFANVMKYLLMGTSSNFGNMFSMAGATLFLPFLPMLPTQILLNNMLYDFSELAIPLDHVDPADIARPRTWDIGLIRNFMLILGPVSSLFDFLTFFVLLKIFHAHESLFHTGWFIESLATQVLVIFVIRTKGNPLHGLPHPLLVGSSVAAVAIGAVLPFTFFGPIIGFTAPPLLFFELLAGMTIAYLGVVELIKRWFFRRHGFPSKQ